jgi:hypothetical protein
MKKDRFEIQYVDAPLERVLQVYADGLKPKGEKQSIYSAEPFVDTSKKRVIFRVTVENHE